MNKSRLLGRFWRPGLPRWFPVALAFVAMLLPSLGWQTLAQFQNREIAGSLPDEDENECGDEDEDGNSAEPDVHLLVPRLPGQSRPARTAGNVFGRLVSERARTCLAGAVPEERDRAACSAARLPLRC